MSRRNFLQNMRQDSHRRASSDADSPRSSDVGYVDNTAATTHTTNATNHHHHNSTGAVSHDRDGRLPEDTLHTTHLTEFTVVSATTVAASPGSSSPLPQTPRTVVDADADTPPQSAARTSNRRAAPSLSPDTLVNGHYQQQQQQEEAGPFSADSPAAWAQQQSSATHPQQQQHRRSVTATTAAVPEVLTTPRALNRRRSSVHRGSIGGGAAHRSPSTGPPTAVRRNSRPGVAAASRAATAQSQGRDRSGSIQRLEASQIALQVELATEKRNNIEAEHHIMTLNAEAEKLRAANARLSRELAEAATHHHHAAQRGASAAATAAGGAELNGVSVSGADGESLSRIEALEARLGELTRNLETKQREMSTKDERIRLLEHKLADQLLLQTGVHYMAIPAPSANAAAAAPSSSSSPLLPHPHYRQHSNASLPGQSFNSATAAAAGPPSRRIWQTDAPDMALAAPRVGAVRHVAMPGTRTHSSGEDPAVGGSARASSSVRRRSPVGHSSGPVDDLRRLSPVPRKAEETAAGRPHATAPHATNGTAETGGGARRPSVRRPPPLRPESTRRMSARRKLSGSSHDGSAAPAHSEQATAPRQMRGDTAEVPPVRPATTTTTTATVQQHSGRLSARRPSVQRRGSAASVREDVADASQQRRGSRRESGTPQPMWQPSAVGHTPHVNTFTSGAASTSGGSVYAMNQRALSAYRATRQLSTTRSVAQQSMRSSTSMRSRPQIAFTSDGDTSTMKGTTATVMFRARDARKESNVIGSNEHSVIDVAGPAATAAPV